MLTALLVSDGLEDRHNEISPCLFLTPVDVSAFSPIIHSRPIESGGGEERGSSSFVGRLESAIHRKSR
jgi:hypothetical protein